MEGRCLSIFVSDLIVNLLGLFGLFYQNLISSFTRQHKALLQIFAGSIEIVLEVSTPSLQTSYSRDEILLVLHVQFSMKFYWSAIH